MLVPPENHFMGLLGRLKGDFIYLKGALRTLRLTTPIAKNPTRVFPHVIDELAARYGDAPALIGARETFSYRQLGDGANRYARWALAQGLAKGETVCLLMPNRPEYMAVWIGIIHAGGVVALLNTNLVGFSLSHCIDVVEAKHVIVAAELMDAFATIETQLKGKPKIWLHGEHGDAAKERARIDRAVDALSGAPLRVSASRAITVT